MVFNAIAFQYYVPVLDLGVELQSDGAIGGRVNWLRPGGACLWCAGVLHSKRVRAEQLPEEARTAELERGYITGLDEPAPAVISINGGNRKPCGDRAAGRGNRLRGRRWVLPIAPSTYHAAKKRPSSKRALRAEQLRLDILRVWDQNSRVYGADKIWAQLNREGTKVARCSVERLMRSLGLKGVIRGRRHRTTGRIRLLSVPATSSSEPFSPPAANPLWVADVTYVRTSRSCPQAAWCRHGQYPGRT